MKKLLKETKRYEKLRLQEYFFMKPVVMGFYFIYIYILILNY